MLHAICPRLADGFIFTWRHRSAALSFSFLNRKTLRSLLSHAPFILPYLLFSSQTQLSQIACLVGPLAQKATRPSSRVPAGYSGSVTAKRANQGCSSNILVI
jgi:hypothetical protein